MSPLAIKTDHGDLPALLTIPDGAEWLYVFAHGAGAGMRHSFMESMAQVFAERRIATLRYEFPYMAAHSRRPDPARVLESTVHGVVTHAARTFPDLRIAAGGKSMGGRMTSRAQAAAPLPRVEALIFLGFPLHPPKKPSVERAVHLADVQIPMLFLQGTRDDLAELDLIRGVTEPLRDYATLHVVEGADHGFAVLKRSGRTAQEVLDEMGDTVVKWLADRVRQPG